MTYAEMGGHNQPDLAKDVTERLGRDYANLNERVDAFSEEANLLPPSVDSKEAHDEYVDLIAKMRGSIKDIDAIRVAEKDPHLKSERAIDGYFFGLSKRLERVRNLLADRVESYLRKVADEERRKREAAAAEERRRAEELRREEADRARKAEEARRRDHRELHTAAAGEAAFEAGVAEQRADEADQAAAAKPADLARTRSTTGTLSTLKSEWVGKIEDMDAIPLEKLRPYISTDSIEKAVRSFVKNGGRQLPGVRIYETEKAMIR